MFSLGTWKKIWDQDIHSGRGYRPLCTDFSRNPPQCEPQSPATLTDRENREPTENTSNRPTFVMYSDPRTGRIWYESSERQNNIQGEPGQYLA